MSVMRHRWLWLWLVLLLAALGAGGLWLALSPPRFIALPDGRRIELRAVTHGTRHRYVHARPLVKALALVMPKDWARRRGLRVVEFATDTPSLMFWVAWRDVGGANEPAAYAAVFDAQGRLSDPAWFSTSVWPAPGETVVGWNFANYPRRAKWVGLRIFKSIHGPQPEPLLDFKARNPGPRNLPVWSASPLPATQRDDNLAATLLSFTADRLPPVPRQRPPPDLAEWTKATFRVTQNGQPTTAWEVAAITLRDATANSCRSGQRSSSARTGDVVEFSFRGALWPDKSACRLMVEFTRAQDFAAEELWTLGGVPVPATYAQPTRTNVAAVVQGLVLTGLDLAQSGSGGPAPLGAWRRNAEMTLRTALPTNLVRVKLHAAADDRGRPVEFKPGLSLGVTNHAYELNIPRDARQVDFTFAVTRSRVVEFLAPPPVRAGDSTIGRR